MEEKKQKSGHSLILYGIIAGVILGFLVGWWIGPSYKARGKEYQEVVREQFFAYLDLNRDEKISRGELERAVERRREEFERLDVDKDGKLVGEELRNKIPYGDDYLKQFDKNRDGKLDLREEFQLKALDFKSYLRRLDKDEDGFLDREEFSFLKLPVTMQKSVKKFLAKFQPPQARERYLQKESEYHSIAFWLELFQLFGEIFLNALKMLIVPLILTSMIGGVTALGDIRRLGKVGIYTVVFYTITTGLSVLTGLILVNIIRPGVGASIESLPHGGGVGEKELSILDVIKGLVHPNIVGAMVELKILPLILFSLILGGILSTMGKKSETTLDVIHTFGEAIMKFILLIMYIAPLGIFGLLAYKVGKAGGGAEFGEQLRQLGWYAFTVILGLGFHAFITLPVILVIFAKRNPIQYLKGMAEALLTAFSTASSSATLPLTMEGVEVNNKVSNKAASFVCPLGATINMDGTALYEAVAAIFIAQVYGIPLGPSAQALIFLTATLAAIGAAGIPEAGLVTMVVVLESVGLPTEGIGLILVIDWFLDRCRTTVNVWGDSVGAVVIDEMVIKKSEAVA